MKFERTIKITFKIFLLSIFMYGCSEEVELSSIDSINWEKRAVQNELSDSLTSGTTYLSVYSEIYSQSEHKTHDLTATISMKNMNRTDTIYIKNAEYFDTKGKSIRRYFDKMIFIAPMESVEIVIDQDDDDGGTGANFLFDWMVKPGSNEPFFEAIMISTYGQQGLSFTTQGKKIDGLSE